MNTITTDRPVRKTPWLTEEDFARIKEWAKQPRTPEQSRQSMIAAGIIDEQGNWIDHPYYEQGYGPKREDRAATE